METFPIRLNPGMDLRRALETAASARQWTAAVVLCGIGSLSRANLRFAGAAQSQPLIGNLELVTLAGTISPNGAHLHATIADGNGAILAGHLGYGCIVRTTGEVLLAILPDWHFSREPDPATGYDELVVRRNAAD